MYKLESLSYGKNIYREIYQVSILAKLHNPSLFVQIPNNTLVTCPLESLLFGGQIIYFAILMWLTPNVMKNNSSVNA